MHLGREHGGEGMHLVGGLEGAPLGGSLKGRGCTVGPRGEGMHLGGAQGEVDPGGPGGEGYTLGEPEGQGEPCSGPRS